MISLKTKNMKKKDKLKVNFSRSTRINLIILGLSLLLIIIFGSLRPSFLSLSNFISMGHQMAIIAIIAFAMTAVILAKGIDLSVGSTLAVSGIVGAVAYQSGLPPLLSICMVIFTGIFVGALNGVLITMLKISPFIATLGTMALGRGAALSLSDAKSIAITNPLFIWLGSARIGIIPVSIFLIFILLAIWWLIFHRTILGRYIYAVGGNQEAARATSINVKRIQFLTYVFTGASAGIASVLLIGRVQSAQPLGGFALEFDVITAVIIGGTLLMGGVGSVLGTLFGAILVTIIRTGLSFFGAPQEVTYIVTGGMVLLSVLLYNPESLKSLNLLKARKGTKLSNKNVNETQDGETLNQTLTLENIGKSYSGERALNDVNFKISSGEVVALVGENGAGKSTLVKILSGIIQPTDGRLLLNEKEINFSNPRNSRDSGIGVIHQHLSLVPELTIVENLYLGREERYKGIRILKRKYMKRKAQKLLEEFDIQINPNKKVSELTVGQCQLIEVVKATLGDPWLIIMDEPTSSLAKNESERLYELIERLNKKNVAILYISHKMEEIYKLCSRAVILRDGNHVGDVGLPKTTEDRIINMMVGRKIESVFPYTKSSPGDVAIEVENISDGGLLRDASFTVKKGEVVVLAGLMGAGRSEALKTIFGLTKARSGTIRINGQTVKGHTPKLLSHRFNMAYIPEDRHESGFVPMLSIAHNLSLYWIQKNHKYGFIPIFKEKKMVDNIIQKVNVRPPDPEKMTIYLSGGNQQKVVLGKWLTTDPQILLLDDPTRGVDVGAKSEIHQLVAELKKQGVAILMVSSELTEALNVADRIVVMHEGSTVGELNHGATEEEVMYYALGLYKKHFKSNKKIGVIT